MAYCPKDCKPCLDDLCYGGNGCLLTGEPMLDRCENCGRITDADWRLCDDCERDEMDADMEDYCEHF